MPAVNEWITCPELRPDASVRLYCIPHAGGGTGVFRSWAKHLPSSVEVRGIQLPGREKRLFDAPFHHTQDAVAAMIDVVRGDLAGPYALFGHSMGALLAFELTRALRRAGAPLPGHLYASGYQAPQVPDERPPIADLQDEAFLDEVDRRYGAVPKQVRASAELMELMLPGLKADISICDTYRYTAEAPLDIPLSAFGGREDHQVSEEDLLAWREQTTGPFQSRVFDGDHFFVQSQEAELLQEMLQSLVALS